MSDETPAQGWWRDRVWSLQERVSAHEARIDGLANTDTQHRDEIHDLRSEIAALRGDMNKGFMDMKATIDLHLGAIRAEMSALSVVEHPSRPKPGSMPFVAVLAVTGAVFLLGALVGHLVGMDRLFGLAS